MDDATLVRLGLELADSIDARAPGRAAAGIVRGVRGGSSRPLLEPFNRYLLRTASGPRYTGTDARTRRAHAVKLTVEIWRHADEPDLIHLTHDRFHAQVTNREGRLGYYPTLYAKLSELLDESGELPAGRRQRGEGKRARPASELGDDTPGE